MLLGKRSLSFFVRVPFRVEGYFQLVLEVYCFHNRYFHEAPAQRIKYCRTLRIRFKVDNLSFF